MIYTRTGVNVDKKRVELAGQKEKLRLEQIEFIKDQFRKNNVFLDKFGRMYFGNGAFLVDELTSPNFGDLEYTVAQVLSLKEGKQGE